MSDAEDRWLTTVVMMYGMIGHTPRNAIIAKSIHFQIRKFWKDHIRNTQDAIVWASADVFWDCYVAFCVNSRYTETQENYMTRVTIDNWAKARNCFVNPDDWEKKLKEIMCE